MLLNDLGFLRKLRIVPQKYFVQRFVCFTPKKTMYYTPEKKVTISPAKTMHFTYDKTLHKKRLSTYVVIVICLQFNFRYG